MLTPRTLSPGDSDVDDSRLEATGARSAQHQHVVLRQEEVLQLLSGTLQYAGELLSAVVHHRVSDRLEDVVRYGRGAWYAEVEVLSHVSFHGMVAAITAVNQYERKSPSAVIRWWTSFNERGTRRSPPATATLTEVCAGRKNMS